MSAPLRRLHASGAATVGGPEHFGASAAGARLFAARGSTAANVAGAAGETLAARA